MEAIKHEIDHFLRENFYVPDGDVIDEETSLRDVGVVDSTGVLEIVSFIEAKYGIHVDDAELLPENLDSIGAIARFVDKKRT